MEKHIIISEHNRLALCSMDQPFDQYINALKEKHSTGVAREHAYRPPLEKLLHTLKPGISIINDPARIACGAPDFILMSKNVPIGYIETKDISAPLHKVAQEEQLQRYRRSLSNLMLTNYLDFHWYVEGELREEVSLGRVVDNELRLDPEGQKAFNYLQLSFFEQDTIKIYRAEKLARRMAHLAKMIDRAITATFEQERENGPFHAQYHAFQDALIPSLTEAEFADMYAQSLTYGMFAARVHQFDKGGGELTRYNIFKYLPSTNPFLADFFYQISGRGMPKAVSWLVDDLAYLLDRADMGEILRQFGQRTRHEDPIIHFYETFLREYDPKLKQSRGVFYTPEPVVSFIVRSLDHILQTHFDRQMGLADRKTLILDAATGTGTFLYFIIQHIYEKLQEMGQAGSWNSYVKSGLLPRLFGFELLMAPYAVAHLKLGIQLRELGYQFDSDERLNIILTNALSEPQPPVEQMGFAQFIGKEGAQASEVKLGKPIMVVVGNPPYSVSSTNNNDYIMKLMDSYKKDVRSERNIQPLNDDYIKFIRFAHDRIEHTGYGVVAMITNHAYLSGLIHRGMRNELLKSFTHIYILDLHGNATTEGQTPDGGKDDNVFDIRQGVAIIFLIKEANSDPSAKAKLFYSDLWGKRNTKYSRLMRESIEDIDWETIDAKKPYYLFRPTNFVTFDEYSKNAKSDDIFLLKSGGIKTHRDRFAIDFDRNELKRRIKIFADLNIADEEVGQRFKLKNTRDWNLSQARTNLSNNGVQEKDFRTCLYRLFDNRSIYFTNDVVELPRNEVMIHFNCPNLALLSVRRIRTQSYAHFFVSKNIVGKDAVSIQDACYVSPLYNYGFPESKVGTIFETEETTREPNLAPSFIRTIGETLGLTFIVPEIFEIQPPTPATAVTFTPEDIFYYAYAVFHSPTYRERYAEFLKIDFPRLPLTPDVRLFRQLARLGYELTQLHLMTHPLLNQLITHYPESGSNEVANRYPQYVEPTPLGHAGRVRINKTQFFDGVDPEIWECQIGGYQPLDKWLRDRRGRILSFEDILHYQKIVVALKETMRLMGEIDDAIPGWPLDAEIDDGV